MDTATVAPLPDRAEGAHLRLCGIVTLEAGVCFAIPVLALLLGAVFSPWIVGVALGFQIWQPLALLVLGWAGGVGVWRLLFLLWNPRHTESRRWLTLAAIGCGCAASSLHGVTIWTGRAPGGLEILLPIVYLPLACTLHLLFLNRRALFG